MFLLISVLSHGSTLYYWPQIYSKKLTNLLFISHLCPGESQGWVTVIQEDIAGMYSQPSLVEIGEMYMHKVLMHKVLMDYLVVGMKCVKITYRQHKNKNIFFISVYVHVRTNQWKRLCSMCVIFWHLNHCYQATAFFFFFFFESQFSKRDPCRTLMDGSNKHRLLTTTLLFVSRVKPKVSYFNRTHNLFLNLTNRFLLFTTPNQVFFFP